MPGYNFNMVPVVMGLHICKVLPSDPDAKNRWKNINLINDLTSIFLALA